MWLVLGRSFDYIYIIHALIGDMKCKNSRVQRVHPLRCPVLAMLVVVMETSGRHIHDRVRLHQPCPNFGNLELSDCSERDSDGIRVIFKSEKGVGK